MHLVQVFFKVILVCLLLAKCHHEQLILPLACLDLLLHESLLSLHGLHTCGQHVNLVEVLLLHLGESLAFLLEPFELTL